MTTPGELDPKLRIRAPLRCDGIGSLDCAEDVESGMRMAIRWLPLEANGDAAAAAMQQLPAHPTLPKIRGTGHVGAAAYVAMEFPDGQLLSTFLDAPLAPEALCHLGAQIADALATVHAQGVFHGELSAESLLVLEGHRTILWDMPLVVANRLTDRRGEERVMASTVRVAAYLSPERAQGLLPSASADVYGLGAVLCLAAGSPQPAKATTLATLFQIASGQWRPQVPHTFSAPVQALVARMVASDASARPSAREVADALSRPLSVAATIPEMPAVRVVDAAAAWAAHVASAKTPSAAEAPLAASPRSMPAPRTMTPAAVRAASPAREAITAPFPAATPAGKSSTASLTGAPSSRQPAPRTPTPAPRTAVSAPESPGLTASASGRDAVNGPSTATASLAGPSGRDALTGPNAAIASADEALGRDAITGPNAAVALSAGASGRDAVAGPGAALGAPLTAAAPAVPLPFEHLPSVIAEDGQAVVTDPGVGPFEHKPVSHSFRNAVIAVAFLIGALAAAAGYLALRPSLVPVTSVPLPEVVTAPAPVAEPVAPPPATTTVEPATAAPAVAVEPAPVEPAAAPQAAEDDVPAPLSPVKGPGHRPAAPKRPVGKKGPEATPAPKPEDFNFLAPEADKPEPELKRPTF
jgi:serine/threonine protein kinase